MDTPTYKGLVLGLQMNAAFLHPETAKDLKKEWFEFQSNLLANVCAARNTPSVLSRNEQPRDPSREWWRFRINLLGAKESFDYTHEFCDRMDDALKNLLSPRSSFSNVYEVLQYNSYLMLDVVSSDEDFATRDYKTKHSANKGLLDPSTSGLEEICHYLYRSKHVESELFPRPPVLEKPLHVGDTLSLSENTRLQFKRLQEGDKMNQKKLPGERRSFHPKDGRDYVDWIWDSCSRGLGEYISAFTKNLDGGAIYYGLQEDKGRTGYIVEGLPLNEDAKMAINMAVSERVRSDLLWIESDPTTANGFKELKPEEIRCQEEPCHVLVDFIEVSGTPRAPEMEDARADDGKQAGDGKEADTKHEAGKAKEPLDETAARADMVPKGDKATGEVKSAEANEEGRSETTPSNGTVPPPPEAGTSASPPPRYILEVRVAPFKGVVFYDPEGPEAYRMEEKEENKFEPVRVSKEEWLERLRTYGWCSKHRMRKNMQCVRCVSENTADTKE